MFAAFAAGPAVWPGGFNAAKVNATNYLYLDAKCGINRVAIRSTLTPGRIALTAARPGLQPGTLTIEAQPVAIKDGLTQTLNAAARWSHVRRSPSASAKRQTPGLGESWRA